MGFVSWLRLGGVYGAVAKNGTSMERPRTPGPWGRFCPKGSMGLATENRRPWALFRESAVGTSVHRYALPREPVRKVPKGPGVGPDRSSRTSNQAAMGLIVSPEATSTSAGVPGVSWFHENPPTGCSHEVELFREREPGFLHEVSWF